MTYMIQSASLMQVCSVCVAVCNTKASATTEIIDSGPPKSFRFLPWRKVLEHSMEIFTSYCSRLLGIAVDKCNHSIVSNPAAFVLLSFNPQLLSPAPRLFHHASDARSRFQ